LAGAGLAHRVRHWGSPDFAAKIDFLGSIDVMCLPTEHEEPKGLSVLEAMAAGVPVVLPAKGAFPELIERSGGGILVDSVDPILLADGLQRLLADDDLRSGLAAAGRRWVLDNATTSGQAKSLVDMISAMSAATPNEG